MNPFLTSRALGLALVALALMAAMVVLGLWQLGVYDHQQRADAASRLDEPSTPLGELIGPDDAFPADGVSAPVTVTGRYVAEGQFEVRDGTTLDVDQAVVTPLAVEGGSVILVVRGQGQVEDTPPAGAVALSGVLEPSDSEGASLDKQRMTGGMRIAALVQDFDQDLYAGYIVRTSSEPSDDLPTVTPPLPEAPRLAGFRNLLYAVQWWLFAGFMAFMWWRIVTDPDDDPSGPSEAADPRATDDSAGSSPASVG